MAECSSCGEQIELEAVFTCNYCEDPYCSEHRLPEHHECDAFRTAERFQRETARLTRGETATIGDEAPSSEPNSPNKTPCEECGRPCPASQTYCSPCQADFESKQTTATREEIAEHWRENGELPPKDESGNWMRWALIGLGGLVVLGVVAALSAGVI